MKCPKCKGDNFEEQELSKVMFCEDCSDSYDTRFQAENCECED